MGVPPSYAPLTADETQAPDDPDRLWIDCQPEQLPGVDG